MEMLERAEKCALTNSVLDFTLHPIIHHPTPDIIAEMPRMAEAGYYSIKIFTLFQFDRRIKDFIQAIDAARQHGMITMMHCEDQPINGYLARRLIGEGKSGIQYYNDSRPDYAEAIATARAMWPSAGPRGRASTWCIYRRRRRWKWPAVIPSRDNACTSRPGPSTSTWTSEITTSLMRRSTLGGPP